MIRVVGALILALLVGGASTLDAVSATAPAPEIHRWSSATLPATTTWTDLTYGGGRWVAVGDGANVATSRDGEHWTTAIVPSGSWSTVSYGNGRFVVLSSDATAAGSTELLSIDGVHWHATRGPSGSWNKIAFGHGRFVAVSVEGQLVTSTTGYQWITTWHNLNFDFSSVAFGDGEFMAVDQLNGDDIFSPDGRTWSFYPIGDAGEQWLTVTYGNGDFYATDMTGVSATTMLGYVWARHPARPSGVVAFGCRTFLEASGHEAALSDYGTAWRSAGSLPQSRAWVSAAYGANHFAVLGADGVVAHALVTGSCAQSFPTPPQQVSGNVARGQVWTYQHPPTSLGSAPLVNYLVTVANATTSRHCVAPVYYEPNCIITGLVNHQVYYVSTQVRNAVGLSAPTDPQFVIPVPVGPLAVWARVAEGSVNLQVTGIAANALGFYPVTTVTVHVGPTTVTCHPSGFGQCLLTVAAPPAGRWPLFATYVGYGHAYRSATTFVRVP